jgi:glucokinase
MGTLEVDLANIRNPMNEPGCLVGLDVGGTKIEAMAVDRELNVLGRLVVPTDTSSAERVVDSIAGAVQEVLMAAGITSQEVQAVGLGVPGQIREGVVELAVNLKLESYPLVETLTARMKLPVSMENDVRSAAMGAYQYLCAHQPVGVMAYLSIGTGISAGLVLNGELFRGPHGMAGEIGHIIFEPDGPVCNCGTQGCLESLASGPAIAKQAIQALQAGQSSILADCKTLTAESVFQAAELNDPVAREIVRKSSAYLARAIQLLVMIYDVDKVVLGGGVSHSGEMFLKPILSELEQIRSQSNLMRIMLPEDKIVLLPKDYSAGGWGAIAIARRLAQNSVTAI